FYRRSGGKAVAGRTDRYGRWRHQDHLRSGSSKESMRTILRGLTRTPVFSLVAIVSLALGIGANTAIFSMLDQLLLRSLPVPNPEELVFLYDSGPVQGHYSSDEDAGRGPS